VSGVWVWSVPTWSLVAAGPLVGAADRVQSLSRVTPYVTPVGSITDTGFRQIALS
jgi:hypothetical protein